MSEESNSWLQRLRAGLNKTSAQLSSGITQIFTHRPLDEDMLDELEALLLQTDLGFAVTEELIAALRRDRFAKEVTPQEVREFLAQRIAAMLEPVAKPLLIEHGPPHIVLVVGVNGNGKTTTIGKLAQSYGEVEVKVMLAAADTFRAAAVEQLRVWAERSGSLFVSGAEGSDPASVAFQAVEQARQQGVQLLFIDTAGRLHNKAGLMAELKKILKVIQKLDPSAPHTVLQVLDATTGQNALQQVEAFRELVNVNALVVTKLDGTAKAGVITGLAKKFSIPVIALGVGEGVADLQAFEAQSFARRLVGLE